MILKNEERRTRGLRVGHKDYYSEVQKKLVSKLFLSISTEGNKRGLQKNHLAEITEISFREMIKLASNSFQNVTSVTMALQKTNEAATAGTTRSYNSSFKLKPVLIISVRSSNGRNRKQPFKRDNNRKVNRKRPTVSNIQTKPCNRCGRTFDAVQLKSCLAIGKTCKNCNKSYHFAKLCRSQQWFKPSVYR